MSRKHYIVGVGDVMLSDTVGFVRELPHSLIDAFKATLEESAQADLLLHVIDASAPDRREQVSQVEAVLAEIGADEVPVLKVYNKADLLDPSMLAAEASISGPFENTEKTSTCDTMKPAFVSARTGHGMAALIDQIAALVTLHRQEGGQRGYSQSVPSRSNPPPKDPRGIDLAGSGKH